MNYRQLLLAGLLAAFCNRVDAVTFVQQHVDPSQGDVVAVIEEWKLVVGEPDPNVIAPQITTTISSGSDLSGLYAIFNLNYQALTEFAPGGMQLQIWNGDNAVTHYRLNADDVLSDQGEEISWKQIMEVKSTGILFQIDEGRSDTWGDFGGDRMLTQRVQCNVNHLNNYEPSVSVTNSGVNFGANRVESLVLERVTLKCEHGNDVVVNIDASALHYDEN